jgi:hypothetical protein
LNPAQFASVASRTKSREQTGAYAATTAASTRAVATLSTLLPNFQAEAVAEPAEADRHRKDHSSNGAMDEALK